jgi:hypothetical protein
MFAKSPSILAGRIETVVVPGIASTWMLAGFDDYTPADRIVAVRLADGATLTACQVRDALKNLPARRRRNEREV